MFCKSLAILQPADVIDEIIRSRMVCGIPKLLAIAAYDQDAAASGEQRSSKSGPILSAGDEDGRG
jgi:hypothetical protein